MLYLYKKCPQQTENDCGYYTLVNSIILENALQTIPHPTIKDILNIDISSVETATSIGQEYRTQYAGRPLLLTHELNEVREKIIAGLRDISPKTHNNPNILFLTQADTDNDNGYNRLHWPDYSGRISRTTQNCFQALHEGKIVIAPWLWTPHWNLSGHWVLKIIVPELDGNNLVHIKFVHIDSDPGIFYQPGTRFTAPKNPNISSTFQNDVSWFVEECFKAIPKK